MNSLQYFEFRCFDFHSSDEWQRYVIKTWLVWRLLVKMVILKYDKMWLRWVHDWVVKLKRLLWPLEDEVHSLAHTYTIITVIYVFLCWNLKLNLQKNINKKHHCFYCDFLILNYDFLKMPVLDLNNQIEHKLSLLI